jgi:hypothetical protein
MISAYQDGRDSSALQSVYSNEILRIRGQVVLLTATLPEFTDRRHKRAKLPFTDNQLGGSFAAIEHTAAPSFLERQTDRVIDTGQSC